MQVFYVGLLIKLGTLLHSLSYIIIPLTIDFKKSTLDSWVAVVSRCCLAAELGSYAQTLFLPPAHLKINFSRT